MNRSSLCTSVWDDKMSDREAYVSLSGRGLVFLLNVSFVNRHKCDNMKNFVFFWSVGRWQSDEGTITKYFIGNIASARKGQAKGGQRMCKRKAKPYWDRSEGNTMEMPFGFIKSSWSLNHCTHTHTNGIHAHVDQQTYSTTIITTK